MFNAVIHWCTTVMSVEFAVSILQSLGTVQTFNHHLYDTMCQDVHLYYSRKVILYNLLK